MSWDVTCSARGQIKLPGSEWSVVFETVCFSMDANFFNKWLEIIIFESVLTRMISSRSVSYYRNV